MIALAAAVVGDTFESHIVAVDTDDDDYDNSDELKNSAADCDYRRRRDDDDDDDSMVPIRLDPVLCHA